MSKIKEALLGFAVGDALGCPYEFRPQGSFKCEDMVGGGVHNQRAGTWTDDTSMVLATMDAIIQSCGYPNADAIMKNFVMWYKYGFFTPYGKCFDIGNTTENAIRNYLHCKNIAECGESHKYANGNGALMRIFPLAFLDGWINYYRRICGLTHNTEINYNCCKIYISILRKLLEIKYSIGETNNTNIDNVVIFYGKTLDEPPICLQDIIEGECPNDGNNAYVETTLKCVLWCVWNTHSYKECVLTAVNFGGDTDTIAALAGAMAGVIYGIGGKRGIPEEWIDTLAKKEYLYDICDRFYRIIK